MIRIISYILVLTALLVAGTPHTEVWVELQSGVKQKAWYLGMQNDSVVLGGQVNGQETSVKLPRSRFVKILVLPDSTPLVLDTPKTAPVNIPAPVTSIDTLTQNSAITVEPEPDPWMGHLIIVPPDLQGVDTNWRQGLQTLTSQLLRERGKLPVISLNAQDIAHFANMEELINHLRKIKAMGLLGTQGKARGDSLQIVFRVIWTLGDSIHSQQASKGTRGDWSRWLLSNEPWQALEKAIGQNLLPHAPDVLLRKTATIYVETDPEGAQVSIGNEMQTCKAPCRIPIHSDTASHVLLWASWKVENHLWSSKANIYVAPGDSLKTLMKLEPAHAFIQLTSQPANAEIYPASEPWSPSIRPWGQTPFLLSDFEPGIQAWRISARGYRDTIVELIPDPTSGTQIHVTLHPLLDPNLLAQQNNQFLAQRRNLLGKSLVGASIGPFLLGGTLLWLAQNDFHKAETIKKNLAEPSSASGPNYLAQVKANKDAVQNGRNKVIIGSSLTGLGLLLSTIGVSIWF